MADTLHATFVDQDISAANRVNAAWLNGVNMAAFAENSGITGVTSTTYQTALTRAARFVNLWDFIPAGTNTKTTDCLAYLQAAITAAAALKCALYVPGLPPSTYYRLSSVCTITTSDLHIFGDGISSLFVIYNAAGANCFTVSAAVHTRFSNIGISGIVGSGCGIEYTAGAHRPSLHNVWIGWVGEDAVRVTSGISGRLLECTFDQNNGYDPAGLGGVVRGNTKRALYVAYQASGFTNDWKCIECHAEANGASSNYQVQIGDTNGSVESFSWIGGLIQGSQAYKEVYFRTVDGALIETHTEPPVGVTANYIIVLDRCTNTVVRGKNVQGDIQLAGACRQSGVEHVRCCGVDISATSMLCFARDGQYNNITTGPASGLIKDRSGTADIRNMSNSANAFHYTGNNASLQQQTYYDCTFDLWLGGVAPSTPCGLTQTGGTLTREATVVHTGAYSAKMVMTGNLTQYLSFFLLPINQFKGKAVVVTVWAYNLTTTSLAQLGMVVTGGASAGTVYEPSFTNDTWERIQVTFNVPSDATDAQIRLTGLIGTVYWDALTVTCDDIKIQPTMTLGVSATPSVLVGPNLAPAITTSDGTTITNFPDAPVGEAFTIFFRHAKTITYGAASIILSGSVNFVGASGDTLTLRRAEDNGYVYEVSRMVK